TSRLAPHTTHPITFTQAFCHHRLLPSFPTRRSSDLLRHRQPCARPQRKTHEGHTDHGRGQNLRHLPRTHQIVRTVDAGMAGRPRSEEHTSELQSRENLVCRLLLEKNKGKQPWRACLS